MKTHSNLSGNPLALLFVLISSLFFLSCESDDETTAPIDAAMADATDVNAPDSDSGDAGMEVDTTVPEMNAQQSALHSIAVNVYRPTFAAFLAATQALQSATNTWSDAPGVETAEASRNAWFDAMGVWQRAELMQVGPAGVAGRRIGGADLRDKIYSFPATNACRVDQLLFSQAYTAEGWANGALFNVQGLDALEYLLFSESLENQCPAAVSLNRTGQWAPLAADPDELWSRRGALAKVLAEQLVIHATTLADTWAEGSTFAQAFINGQAPFDSFIASQNQVFAGIFYIDKFVKDLKLGKPAGITSDCESDICPNALESRFAQVSKENLLANIEGFRQLFHGGGDESGFGFDDLLTSEGAGELSSTILSKITAAADALNSIDGTLADALVNDPQSVREAHAAVKTLTDDLKTQFVTILNLVVPQEGAGDND